MRDMSGGESGVAMVPEDAEAPCDIHFPREIGEIAIARLCQTATREYAWIFEEGAEVWHYLPVEYSETVTDTRTHGGFEVPPEVLSPPSRDASFYHNHHRVVLARPMRENELAVRLQMPSMSDLGTAVVMLAAGYRDFRIVTALGVTRVTLDPDRAAQVSNQTSERQRADGKRTAQSQITDDVEQSVNDALDALSNLADGIFTLRFQPIPQE